MGQPRRAEQAVDAREEREGRDVVGERRVVQAHGPVDFRAEHVVEVAPGDVAGRGVADDAREVPDVEGLAVGPEARRAVEERGRVRF